MTEASNIETANADAKADAPNAKVVLETQLAGHPLLPDENPADKEQLRIALMAEFNPTTAYQRRLAQQLVEYEWEIDRHRRFRDLSVLGRYFERAKAELYKRLPGVQFERKTLSKDDLMLARDLVGSDRGERIQAERDLIEETCWDPQHLMAIAAGDCPAANAHEDRIRDLERRRNVLRKELEELKKVSKALIEDAEIIEAKA